MLRPDPTIDYMDSRSVQVKHSMDMDNDLVSQTTGALLEDLNNIAVRDSWGEQGKQHCNNALNWKKV